MRFAMQLSVIDQGKFVLRHFTIGRPRTREMFSFTGDALTVLNKGTTRTAGAPASPWPVFTVIGPAGKASPAFPRSTFDRHLGLGR